MKNKGIGTAAVIVVIIIIVAAAGVYFLFLREGPYGSPEATMRTCADAINDRDAETVYNCLSSDIQGATTKSEIENWIDVMDNKDFHVTIEEVTSINIVDDTATAQVKTKITYIDPKTGEKKSSTDTDEVSFVKEDGKWKINEPIGE